MRALVRPIDLGYYAYLAANVPVWEVARAVAARARRKLRQGLRKIAAATGHAAVVGTPTPAQAFLGPLGPRRGLVQAQEREESADLLRRRWPDHCRLIVREAKACSRGEIFVFGRWTDCRKSPFQAGGAAAAIDYDRDPLAPGVRYDPEQPGPEQDLFRPGADAKAAWEVGRLQQLWRYGQARWLAQTPEERSTWARAYVATVRQFRADCPAGHGVQWSCAMEVAQRATNLALSFAYVQDDAAAQGDFASELLASLDEHGRWVEEHLEETGAVRTNHYAVDLVGLVVAGALFPELPRAETWLRRFGRKLWDEILRQCRPDGTHFESSTGYQRLCAELFLVALLSARAAGSPAPAEVERAVAGLFRSLAALLKLSGCFPQIGDLDSVRGLPLSARAALDGSSLAPLGAAALLDPALKPPRADCAPEVAWLLGASGVERYDELPARGGHGSVLLGDAGIAVLRDGEGYLCLTAAPNGQGGCGGHAHNDKNGVELSWGAVDLVCDRGTYVYARDPAERDRRRGTAAHSTLQVDGAEQNRILPGRLFALPDTSCARILWMRPCAGAQAACGEHRGYARLGVIHRRIAALDGGAGSAAFCDEVVGRGEHLLDLRWIVPQEEVRVRAAAREEARRLEALQHQGLAGREMFETSRCVEVRVAGEPFALFAFAASIGFELSVEETDVSPGYGELLPARLVLLRLQGSLPVRICTVALMAF